MTKQPVILFLTSEVVPFSKSGGLADVAGALPEALTAQGCAVTVVSPFHGNLLHGQFETVPVETPPITVEAGGTTYPLTLRTPISPPGQARHLFVQNPVLFDRPGLYGDPRSDEGNFEDNDIRFSVFCRGVLEWLRRTGWRPDIVHLNDWQTALVAPYLRLVYPDDPILGGLRTVLTIHNLGYQGLFPAERFDALGFDPELFRPLSSFEFWGKVNFLKAGLLYADKISTVSPTYAAEIQSDDERGAGLAGVLHDRKGDLCGILNGTDPSIWNPSIDPHIAKKYSAARIPSGKRANKAALCDIAGFPASRHDRPLIGMISRLADQKGFDLIAEAAGRLFSLDVNFILLGTGDPKIEKLFTELEKRYKDRLRAFLAFDNALAHQIEAGVDMFLMPSRYEPCGLNQLYSLAYATVPIVRATGGLADTVIDADAESKTGTGFVFREYTPEAMLDAIGRAIKAWADSARWSAIRRRGTASDFSWNASAERYLELYSLAQRVDPAASIHHH